MYLSAGDMFAVVLALILLNTALIIAFRRVYVLEKEASRLRRVARAEYYHRVR
jgi:DICT domain-containing protein